MDLSFDEQAVIEKLGLDKSNPKLQKQVIIRVRQMLADRLQRRLEAEMTEQDYKKLATLSDEAAQEWLSHRFSAQREWLAEDLRTTVDFMAAHSATVSALQAHHLKQ